MAIIINGARSGAFFTLLKSSLLGFFFTFLVTLTNFFPSFNLSSPDTSINFQGFRPP